VSRLRDLSVIPQGVRGITAQRCPVPSARSFAGCIDCTSHTTCSDSDDMSIQTPQVDLLTRLLAASEQRQQVISNNIANVNTPEYRSLELQFENALAAEITRKEKPTGSPAAASVTHAQGLAARADGNNVDIDRELGLLNKNAMLQQLYLQLIGTDMNQMRRAMEGGP